MTQEELDALMGGDIDLDAMEDEVDESSEEIAEEETTDESTSQEVAAELRKTNNPPPAIDENKMVDQLDVVTKESEEKASEIFDKLDEVSEILDTTESSTNDIISTIEANIKIFEALSAKFPEVSSFSEQVEQNRTALESANTIVEQAQEGIDHIMIAMDTMQYQDIHRQKIERVINVIRSLSGYLNILFSSDKKDDIKRAPSASHLPGDDNETVDADEIEALLASFGN
ncbi:MAG: chemotaxis protein [Helicobacteraceae bacterium]|nr:chemotaxis protein [Helicobacteraceae bacterium]